MFTDNYIRLQHNLFFGVMNSSYSLNYLSGKNLKNHLGTTTGFYNTGFNYLGFNIGNSMGYPKCAAFPTEASTSTVNAPKGVYFGTGSTPATLSDYKLESPIESGLSFGTSNVTPVIEDSGNGKYSVMATYTVFNTTDADINIYEIGAFAQGQTGASAYYGYLLERTVLTEPITIPAGKSKLVTYKITFNQTLNVE